MTPTAIVSPHTLWPAIVETPLAAGGNHRTPPELGRGMRGMRENGEDKLVREFENCENGNRSTFELESWRENSY